VILGNGGPIFFSDCQKRLSAGGYFSCKCHGFFSLTKLNQINPNRASNEFAKSALKAQKNVERQIALTGRWFELLAQYPRRRCACLGLLVNCPFGAFFSLTKIIQTKTKFLGIHLGSFG